MSSATSEEPAVESDQVSIDATAAAEERNVADEDNVAKESAEAGTVALDTKSIAEKRKIDTEDTNDDAKKLEKARKRQKRIDWATPDKGHMLHTDQRFDLQRLDFGAEDRARFEDILKTLAKHAEMQQRYSVTTCLGVLGQPAYDQAEITDSEALQLQARLRERSRPYQLFRVASARKTTQYRCTNGLDRRDRHVPAIIYKEKRACALDLPNVPELRKMLGYRLMWVDWRQDQTLSWTQSILFVIVLGTCREYRGDKDISLYLINAHNAWRPAEDDEKSSFSTAREQLTDFYFAPDLISDLNLAWWSRWSNRDRVKLLSNWYTHEFISHHKTSISGENYQAELPDLINSGLRDFLSELWTAEDEAMKSLYDRCVYVRSRNFALHRQPIAIDLETLEKADKLARCFLSAGSTETAAPLHILLSFLGLRCRPAENEVFREWIVEHYTASDVEALHYERSLRVANNLPEQMQTLSLGREACEAWALEPFAETRVWAADSDFDMGGMWVRGQLKTIKTRKSEKRTFLNTWNAR